MCLQLHIEDVYKRQTLFCVFYKSIFMFDTIIYILFSVCFRIDFFLLVFGFLNVKRWLISFCLIFSRTFRLQLRSPSSVKIKKGIKSLHSLNTPPVFFLIHKIKKEERNLSHPVHPNVYHSNSIGIAKVWNVCCSTFQISVLAA